MRERPVNPPPPDFAPTLARIAAKVRARRRRRLFPLLTEASGVRLAVLFVHTRATKYDLARWAGVSPEVLMHSLYPWITVSEREAARQAKLSATRKADPALCPPRPDYGFDWESVDWRLPDGAVAGRLGCSIQSVFKARQRLGKAPSACPKCSEATARALGLTGRERRRVERRITRRLLGTDATVHSIAAEKGLSPGTVYRILARHTTPEQRREAKNRKISATRKANAEAVSEARRVRGESESPAVEAARRPGPEPARQPPPPETPRERGRRAAEAFVRALDEAA